MSKKRARVPADVKRYLILEAGNKCSMPRCLSDSSLEIHHIDENPENNALNNLLLLCANHHTQVTKKVIDRKTCQLIKQSLNETDNDIPINSRNEFMKHAIFCLNDSNRSYRNITVGPLFLNPTWLVERRDSLRSTPNFDRELFHFISKNSQHRNHEIRIMFSLSLRYKEKIDSLISINERGLFVKDVTKNVLNLFGKNYLKGPDICCCHSGFSSIDMIFDDALISTYRSNMSNPTSTGVLSRKVETVNKARVKFDNIFDSNSSGQENEIKNLIQFIRNLWIK